MTPAVYIWAVLTATVSPYLPHPADKDGWGLRVANLTTPRPVLVGEWIGTHSFDVILLNHSPKPLTYTPLAMVGRPSELDVKVDQPNGRGLSGYGRGGRRRHPFAVDAELAPGKLTAANFKLGSFLPVTVPGRHQVVATLELHGKTLTSPPAWFEVVEVPADGVLISQALPVEGFEAAKPVNEQGRYVIQQVKIGKQVLLIYRRYVGTRYGGGVEYTYRLAELPGKVEMKVEGAYGAWNPLTITYKDANSPTGSTKLVIHSVDGTPWTDKDEASWREREKKSAKP